MLRVGRKIKASEFAKSKGAKPISRVNAMVALAGYFDESKSAAGIAIAGYVGTVDDLSISLPREWKRRVIDASPLKISEYKTHDCRHGVGEFAGWSVPERTALTTACVDTIIDKSALPNIVGVGAVVLAQTPADIGAVALPGKVGDLEGFAYCMCFWWVMEAALLLAERHLGSDDLQLVFDDERRLRQRSRTVFELGLLQYPRLARRVRRPEFLDSKTALPLQAADLLAHETLKEMRSRRETPPRKISRALERLVAGRLHVAHFCDPDMFREIRRNVNLTHPAETLELPDVYRPFEVTRYR